jgi:hypothetical protein
VKDWKFYFSSSVNLFLCGLLSFGSALSIYTSLSNGRIKSLFSHDDFYFWANESALFSVNILLRLLFFGFSTVFFIFSLNDIATFNYSLYQIKKWRSFRNYQIQKKFDLYFMFFLVFAMICLYFYGVFILKSNIMAEVFSDLFR